MFDINPGLIVWTIVTFVLLVVVLGKFAWRPLLQTLHEREEKVRRSLEQAEKARLEAAGLLKQNAQMIARAEVEYQKIIREGRAMAEKMKEDIMMKTRQQAQRELQLAKEEIQRDIEAAKQQLRVEVADLAIRVAERVLDETLDQQRHRKLIDSFLNQLPKS